MRDPHTGKPSDTAGRPATMENPHKSRILAITTVDVMPWILLRPWLHALRGAGYEVHIACARGRYFEALGGEGFAMHEVALRRSLNPIWHLRPLLQLFRLIRSQQFEVINTHSPVAAVIGRFAAWLGDSKRIVCTVHGFYFHERMPWFPRSFFMGIEWLAGRLTDHFMFVSDEDRRTALRLGIAADPGRATTIYNGVDLNRFTPHPDTRAAGRRMVAGIVARIVREKGYVEFLEMAFALLRANKPVTFLIVGDSLETDRDQYGSELRARVRASGFVDRFILTGFTPDVEEHLKAMDIFVLPSYREGFPRSILEAMACGLPVVTTDIRGCREAVVDGTTGLIVPPRDAQALTAAVSHLLDHPELARQMGDAGRRRAVDLFDTKTVEKRFVQVFDSLLARAQNRDHEAADLAAATPLPNYLHRAG